MKGFCMAGMPFDTSMIRLDQDAVVGEFTAIVATTKFRLVPSVQARFTYARLWPLACASSRCIYKSLISDTPAGKNCQGCVVKPSSQQLKEGFNARPHHCHREQFCEL